MTPSELFLEAIRRSDSRDHEGFLAMQAPDCEWVVPGAELHGRDEVREWLEAFWQGFSSYKHLIDRVVESGDTVFAEGTWSGLHDGPLVTPEGEIPPTGKTVGFRFAIVIDGDLDAGHARSAHIY